jgi:predicted nucleic acid-binding protein
LQTIIGDSSSLIYLSKADLLCSYAQIVRLIISPHVYEECTRQMWAEDAQQIRGMVQEKRITICPVPDVNQLTLSHLGAGEKSTIELYYLLKADSIVIDDRKGIRICQKHHIPFLCAILVPGILQQSRMLSGPDETDQFIEKICRIGRYNQWIIQYARENKPQSELSSDRHRGAKTQKA